MSQYDIESTLKRCVQFKFAAEKKKKTRWKCEKMQYHSPPRKENIHLLSIIVNVYPTQSWKKKLTLWNAVN